MSLRSRPLNERRTATVVILALAALLGLGLATSLRRELRPDPATQAPPVRSRLVAVLEGVMAVNVTPAERERFKAWVAAGATRADYAQVEGIVTNNCASCHDRGGQYPRLATFADLQPIALEPAPTGLGALFTPRVLHLFAFPLLLLVAVFGYLRRVGGRRWQSLAATSATALAGDMMQWSWRQGRPDHAWAAWLAAAALALCMAAVAGVVLRSLWRKEAGAGAA